MTVAVVGLTVAGVGIAEATSSVPSVYTSIAPVTVLGRSLAADSNTDVVVAGVGSVPSNATSVQLSVTALSGTTTSSMYVYPTGATKPTSANVRWETGETVTIPVTVAVGTSGKIHLSTDAGTVTVKVAVVGYFSPVSSPGGASYVSRPSGDIAVSNTNTTITSVTVPAGTYEVQGRIYASYTGDTGDVVTCEIEDPSSNVVDTSFADLEGTYSTDMPVVVFGLDTTSGGAFSLLCHDVSSDVYAYALDLMVVQVHSVSGDAAGG